MLVILGAGGMEREAEGFCPSLPLARVGASGHLP